MADYPAGVYDLYMKYLNEMDQSGVATDFETYASQLPYNIEQGDGGANISSPDQRISDFQTIMDTRQKRLQDPGKVASLIGNYIPQQRSVMDMMRSGVKDERLTSGLPFGLAGIAAKMLPDKYYDMPLGDQAFIQSQMGYTDPETNIGNKDPFGINVRSMFGNYADYVVDEAEKLEAIVADQIRRGLTNTLQKGYQSDVGLIKLAKQKEKEGYTGKTKEAEVAANIANQAAIASSRAGIGRASETARGQSHGSGDAASRMGGGSRQAKSGSQVAGGSGRTDKGWGWREGGRVGYADKGFVDGTPIADVTETEATLIGDDNVSLLDFLKITGGGSYGENTDIMYEGEIIPGLDQTNYGYGFDVGAEVPIGNTGLTLTGDAGIGRGSTDTTYMGENVPFLSGVGETKLGDQWNVGIEGKWPVNFNELFMEEGGRVGFLKGSPDDTTEVRETTTEPGSDKMAYFPGDVFSSSQVRALFKDRSLSTNMDRKQLYHILMNPGKYPAAESMLLRLLKQKGLQSGGLAGLPN